MANEPPMSDPIDPLHEISGFSLFPRTLRALIEAGLPPDNIDLDHVLKHTKIRSPERVLAEAKAIVDGSSELLNSEFAQSLSFGIDRDAVALSDDEKLLKEAKKLPWEERLAHRDWKVRRDANIDLAVVCDCITDPKDPRIREFGPFFRKTVVDSSLQVQEKALEALIAYLKAADADAARYAKEICDAIVAKCLKGRPKTVEKAQEAFMLWVELEAVEPFLDGMEEAIKKKVATAVVPAIDVMFQALSEFGSKIVPPERILKMLPELFDHQDQNVLASSKGLTLELCRWIGKDAVKSILFVKMRDTMKKELEAELVNVTEAAQPTRKIRSEQDKEPEQEAVSDVVGPGPSADVPQKIDEYERVHPVDVLISDVQERVVRCKRHNGKENKWQCREPVNPGSSRQLCPYHLVNARENNEKKRTEREEKKRQRQQGIRISEEQNKPVPLRRSTRRQPSS